MEAPDETLQGSAGWPNQKGAWHLQCSTSMSCMLAYVACGHLQQPGPQTCLAVGRQGWKSFAACQALSRPLLS